MGSKGVVEKIKYWRQLLLLPLYAFSFLTIRKKNVWLFGSTFGSRFADNPRYLYLYLSKHTEEGIRPIWITKNKDVYRFLKEKGLTCYLAGSIKGIFWCLHAKVYIFDNYSKDISFFLSGGAKKINLWHGVGNKKINYDNIHDKVRHPKNLWERFKYFPRRLSDEKPGHYVLATSETMKEIFATAFRVPQNHIILEGYPRNDILFSDADFNIYTEEETKIIELMKVHKESGKTIYQYYPTFRRSENMWQEAVDTERLDRFLEANNAVLYIKPHPKSFIREQISKINYKNIISVKPNVDVYAILAMCDVMITDYSSVYSDFLLTKKPSVIFVYDEETYYKDTRECYFDKDEYMPEKKLHTQEELETHMITDCLCEELLSAKEKIKKKMFLYDDGNACRRLTGKIKEIVRG